MNARNLRIALLSVAVFPVADTANAACSAPSRLRAEVGINISRTQLRSSAPGIATLTDENGAECFGWTVSGQIKIIQHNPEVEYVVSGSGAGHWLYTLDAPAQPGSCYNSTITAQGGYHWGALTGSDAAGPVCWDPNDVQPAPPPRNCTPIWDVEGQVWLDSDCETPILLNLGTGTYQLTSAADGVRFDLRADGSPRRVAWTTREADIAFLAFDRNANGSIDNGAELFGSATVLASGRRAKQGFEAVAELDANGDGVLSPLDPLWTALVLWTDRNHDGTSAPGELQRLSDSRVAWLSTGYHDEVNRHDQWGNLFRYMSHAGMRIGTTENIRQIAYYDVLLTSE